MGAPQINQNEHRSRCDLEVLSKCKEILVEESATWKEKVTRGYTLSLDGKEIAGRGYSACHAWVHHTYAERCFENSGARYGSYAQAYKEKYENFLTLTCHSKVRSKGICSVEAHEAIILWMASDECPFHQFVLNRDDEESLLNGGLIILCGPDGATLAQTMWMCKVLRYGVEASNALDTWLVLKKGGVNPLLALYVASQIRTLKGAEFGYTGFETHSTVFSDYGFNPKGLLTGEAHPQATSTAEVFGATTEAKASTVVKGFCAPYKKSDGWGGYVTGSGATADDLVKKVLEWQQSLEESFKPKRNKAPSKDAVFLELDL